MIRLDRLHGFRGKVACAACFLLLAACSPMPPDVDTTGYVPLALVPAHLAGIRDARGPFRELFCRETGLDSAMLEDACGRALRSFRDEAPVQGTTPAIESRLRSKYRVGVALGMGWDCMRELIDEDELPSTRLREFGYDTVLFEVEGLSGSERNADIIARTLTEMSGDERPFILIGYSKGIADILVTLQKHPETADMIAAVVSVAGAVGGSPMVEHTSRTTMFALRNSPFGQCSNGDGEVLASLHPAIRHGWLSDNLPLSVPTYSLVTAPEPNRVSRALRSSYKLLGAVHPINDGALLHWDQLLPGSTLLGYANADHWAAAVPIHVKDVPLGGFFIENTYPRTRLWLAIADFVVSDLDASTGAARAPAR